MAAYISTWPLRRKSILAAVSLAVLVALWWTFRPEKLWINEKVNEPAPFVAASDPHPILTGRFEGGAQQTSGRATIYKKPGGEQYLRLSDFTITNAADAHVVLARSDDPSLSPDMNRKLESIDLGPLKANQESQNYDLPAATDLSKYDAVVIYNQQMHMLLGLAKLEPF